jgi:hypothetical protein
MTVCEDSNRQRGLGRLRRFRGPGSLCDQPGDRIGNHDPDAYVSRNSDTASNTLVEFLCGTTRSAASDIQRSG